MARTEARGSRQRRQPYDARGMPSPPQMGGDAAWPAPIFMRRLALGRTGWPSSWFRAEYFNAPWGLHPRPSRSRPRTTWTPTKRPRGPWTITSPRRTSLASGMCQSPSNSAGGRGHRGGDGYPHSSALRPGRVGALDAGRQRRDDRRATCAHGQLQMHVPVGRVDQRHQRWPRGRRDRIAIGEEPARLRQG